MRHGHRSGSTYELTPPAAKDARRVGREGGDGRRGRPAPARRIAVHHDLFASAALRGAVRATTKRADVVVAASQAIADELRLPATILHPGVDLDAFIPDAAPRRPAARR